MKTGSTEDLKNALVNKEQLATGGVVDKAVTPYRRIEASLNAMLPKIKEALPNTNLTAERLTKVALTSIRNNPTLQECDQTSLLVAIMNSATLGLEINDMIGQCYLIPFKDRKTGVTSATLQISYKGMIELCCRSGEVLSFQARTIYSNDTFEIEYGLDPKLKHIPAIKDRGEPIYFYAIARLKNGIDQFEVMSKEDCDKVRDNHSQSYRYQKENSIWAKHYESMCHKTVIKKLCKLLPLSISLQEKLAHDETYQNTPNEDPKQVFFEGEFSEVTE